MSIKIHKMLQLFFILEFHFYMNPSSYRSYSIDHVEKWEQEQLGGFVWDWMLYK